MARTIDASMASRPDGRMRDEKPSVDAVGRTGSRAAGIGGNLILAVASALVFLVLLEAGARSYYWVSWGRRLYPIESRVYSIPLGWRLEPGEYSHLRINGQGFRGTSETAVAPAAGTTRVFVVGGSTAFGSDGLYPQVAAALLTEETTIDRHLERLLNQRHP